MTTIRAGQLAIQDPNDSSVYALEWEDTLAEGVQIIDEGVITIESTRPGGSPMLEADELARVDGNRSARVRLTGGEVGYTYRVSHRIETNENPSQTKEQSFFVLIQNR